MQISYLFCKKCKFRHWLFLQKGLEKSWIIFCNYLMLDIIPQPLLLFTAGSRRPNWADSAPNTWGPSPHGPNPIKGRGPGRAPAGPPARRGGRGRDPPIPESPCPSAQADGWGGCPFDGGAEVQGAAAVTQGVVGPWGRSTPYCHWLLDVMIGQNLWWETKCIELNKHFPQTRTHNSPIYDECQA